MDEAAWKGQVEAARLLIERGADVRTRSVESGATPLHEAALKGHAEMVELLLEKGAEIGAKDASGATALDEALRFRHARVVEVLMAHGAGMAAPTQMKEAVLRGQADVVAILLERGADGKPFLHDAALKGHTRIVELLIESGAPVNGKNKAGATAPPMPQRQNEGIRKLVVRLPGKIRRVDIRVALEPQSP